MTIRDYISKVKDDVAKPTKEINWPLTLEQAGYYSHHLCNLKHWTDIHQWCQEYIGEAHYAWTGSVFWFERQEDAVFFKLRWA